MLHTTKIKICRNFLFYKSILYYYSTCIFGNVCHPIAFRSQICGMVFCFFTRPFLGKNIHNRPYCLCAKKIKKENWSGMYLASKVYIWHTAGYCLKKSTMHNRSKTMDLHHTHKTTHKKCRVHIFCEMLDHIMHTVQ